MNYRERGSYAGTAVPSPAQMVCNACLRGGADALHDAANDDDLIPYLP